MSPETRTGVAGGGRRHISATQTILNEEKKRQNPSGTFFLFELVLTDAADGPCIGHASSRGDPNSSKRIGAVFFKGAVSIVGDGTEGGG